MQKDSLPLTNDLNPDYEMMPNLDLIKQKQLLLPSLLVLQGNQPLAFVSGQLLHLFTPILTVVAPNWMWDRWASLLSTPKGLAHLLKNLEEDL